MKTPMVEEDEVLVMDGVPVSPLVGSGSSSNSSSSSSGKSVYKKELRRDWEDLGHCRYAAMPPTARSLSHALSLSV